MPVSVGRIVHFVGRGGVCVAALVTATYEDGSCDVTTFRRGWSPEPVNDVTQDEDGKAAGTWHWPERS